MLEGNLLSEMEFLRRNYVKLAILTTYFISWKKPGYSLCYLEPIAFLRPTFGLLCAKIAV